MFKQIIIARKDLNMSPGKLAAQVSHGSMAFISNMIKKHTARVVLNRGRAWYIDEVGEKIPQHYRRGDLDRWAEEARECGEDYFYYESVNPKEPYGKLQLCDMKYCYKTNIDIDISLYENWFNGSFTKCVLEARNKTHLLKAKNMAEELGMVDGKDFFCIYDNCYTELEPEEEDGTTLTCIGFMPMDAEMIDKIGKKYQLYK